ncbi:hypothetical protein NS44R_14755, partial [Mammaliicoccus sciuri]
DVDRQQRDHAGHHHGDAPTEIGGDETGDRAGERGADAPGRAGDADDAAAQPRRPGFRHQHRAERPFAVEREEQQRARDHEHCECRRQRRNRHQQREQRDVDREQCAAAVAVGEPRPEIEPGDADEQRDLHAGAILRQGELEFLDHHRRDQREDHAVHAVEAPAERVGGGDVPMGLRQLGAAGDGAVVGVLQVFLFERTDIGIRIAHRRRGVSVSRDAAHAASPDCSLRSCAAISG